MVANSTGRDPKQPEKSGNGWKHAFADPSVAPKLPFGPEVMAFIGEAAKHLPPES
jgi:hypothetical protein